MTTASAIAVFILLLLFSLTPFASRPYQGFTQLLPYERAPRWADKKNTSNRHCFDGQHLVFRVKILLCGMGESAFHGDSFNSPVL